MQGVCRVSILTAFGQTLFTGRNIVLMMNVPCGELRSTLELAKNEATRMFHCVQYSSLKGSLYLSAMGQFSTLFVRVR